jgi:GrpB-like predicted nucleotidyltransferase (UPF0157 family)
MDEIEIVPHYPGWPALYEAERAWLVPVLAPFGLIEIAHVGSTAVPGLAAKPIIDIAARIASLAIAREHAIVPLAEQGYRFWAANPDPDELFFAKGVPPHAPRRTHHLHVMERAEPFRELVRFRGRLRVDAETARRYAALKRDLAARYRTDREAYTKGKTEFVAAVLARA